MLKLLGQTRKWLLGKSLFYGYIFMRTSMLCFSKTLQSKIVFKCVRNWKSMFRISFLTSGWFTAEILWVHFPIFSKIFVTRFVLAEQATIHWTLGGGLDGWIARNVRSVKFSIYHLFKWDFHFPSLSLNHKLH